MGIFIALKSQKKGRRKESSPDEARKSKLDMALGIISSLKKYFEPTTLSHWFYAPLEEIGGELVREMRFDEAGLLISSGNFPVSWNSVIDISGTWGDDADHLAHVVISYYPNWRAIYHDISINIEPSDYEDLTELIYSSATATDDIKEMIEILRTSVNDSYGVKSIFFSRLTPEDAPETISAFHSTDLYEYWKLAKLYLSKDEETESDKSTLFEKMKPYKDEVIYKIMEDANSPPFRRKEQMLATFSIDKLTGSIILIGKGRENVGKFIHELGPVVEKVFSSLDDQDAIKSKINRGFGLSGLQQQRLVD